MATAEGVEPTARRRRRRRLRDRDFFLPVALVQFALVFWGFGPTFFWTVAAPAPHPSMLTDRGAAAHALFMVHGVVFAAWMALYVLQSALTAAGRVALHRRLGLAATGLAALIVALGLAVSVEGLRVGFHIRDTPPAAFFTGSAASALAFGGFFAMGYLRRREPGAHKRWMMLATMMLTGAAVARISLLGAIFPGWFDATALLLPALALWDAATLRRLHPVTLWGGLAFLFADMAIAPLAANPAWLAFLRPLTG